jgi:hypothetical protein
MSSACHGFYIPTIYKIIWHRNPNVYEKHIFVGYCDATTTAILKKIGEHGYSVLSPLEMTTLTKTYPTYQSVFGEILPGRTHFVDTLIDDYDCIAHITEDMHTHFKIPISNIYMWYMPLTITHEYFGEYIKCLYAANKQTLTTEQFS